uniref:GB1/RHD3-type G domain-containing protein n=1 Tax=Catagonus wagneri TaxID=51154 RepID=A0A8C3WQX9_9CETA
LKTLSHISFHYVTELTDRIRAKSSPGEHEVKDSADFLSFFPDFVWTLRDFSLDLEANGEPITADEYLAISLQLNDKKTKLFNAPRLCIRKFFPEKKCFIFDRPAQRKQLVHLELLPEEVLSPEFREQVEDFCSYIYSHSKAKTLSGGIIVNGPRLETLVLTYINAISSGDLPCMENAVLALAEIENSVAVRKAIAHYEQQMAEKLQLPTETLQELLDLHRASEKEAIEVFMDKSFKDVNHEFQKILMERLETKLDDFCAQNTKASSGYCMTLLQDIFGPLYEDVKQGTFSKPGGFRLFTRKKQELKNEYYRIPRKGVQANKVLRSFLQSQVAVEKSILQADRALTDGQKAMAEKPARKEAAEKGQELLKQRLQEQEQQTEARQRSVRENIPLPTEELRRERENTQREQNTMLDLRVRQAVALACLMGISLALQHWVVKVTASEWGGWGWGGEQH